MQPSAQLSLSVMMYLVNQTLRSMHKYREAERVPGIFSYLSLHSHVFLRVNYSI